MKLRRFPRWMHYGGGSWRWLCPGMPGVEEIVIDCLGSNFEKSGCDRDLFVESHYCVLHDCKCLVKEACGWTVTADIRSVQFAFLQSVEAEWGIFEDLAESKTFAVKPSVNICIHIFCGGPCTLPSLSANMPGVTRRVLMENRCLWYWCMTWVPHRWLD